VFCQAFLPALDLLVSLIPHGSPIHLTSQGPALSFSAEGNHPSLTDPSGENAKPEMLLVQIICVQGKQLYLSGDASLEDSD